MHRFTSLTRRRLLRHTGLVAGIASIDALSRRPLLAQLGSKPEPAPPITDPRLKALAQAALDTASSLGATYADVRLSTEQIRVYGRGNGILAGPDEQEFMTAGVRVLVDGYWGFASTAMWNKDELARIAREAYRIAKMNAVGRRGQVELAVLPQIANGHWETPIELNPFDVADSEILDCLRGVMIYTGTLPHIEPRSTITGAEFRLQNKAFASTDGGFCTQRIFQTSGLITFGVQANGRKLVATLDGFTPAGVGWELFRLPGVRDAIKARQEEAVRDLSLPIRPVDPGRSDIIFDSASTADLVSKTLGQAMELDRVMGFEANAGGTSYIRDPNTTRTTLRIGAPLLNVTADATMTRGAATVAWDDEGVAAKTFPLVAKGVLTDFQTNREGASWLRESYTQQGRDIVSHGCARAQSAADPQLTTSTNLVLQPDASGRSLDDLVRDTPKGILIRQAMLNVDFQLSSGLVLGTAFEVRDGKRSAILTGLGVMFQTADLWKNLKHVGGVSQQFGIAQSKGEPLQSGYHSVSAPPIVVGEQAVIDVRRKA